MAAETSYHLKLPEDLLIEIFLRSSVKSLLLAKCVCKDWYALISNTGFVHKHLQYQKSHDKGHLLLQYFKEDTQEYTYLVFDDKTLSSNSYREVGHIQGPGQYYLHLEGPVNGLYCLFNNQSRIVLWNPALMEARTIPQPQSHFFPQVEAEADNYYFSAIGFGMDPLTHDYKIVLIRRSVYSNDSDFTYYNATITFTGTIYNLTTNTWKLLTLLEGEDPCNSYNSSFLDGIYYWWSDQSQMVIAFDMGEETFRRILGPVLADPIFGGSLTIYNDKVAYLHKNQFAVDVWVMLEEGNWTKQFSITSPPGGLIVFGLWKNDGIFLAPRSPDLSYSEVKTQIALCSFSTQEMTSLGLEEDPLIFRASIYHESLVPVYSASQHNGRHASLDTLSDFFSVQE